MSRPLRIQFEDAVCHVTSRVNDRRDIVKDDDDRVNGLAALEESTDRYDVQLLAWCLMENRFRTPQGLKSNEPAEVSIL